MAERRIRTAIQTEFVAGALRGKGKIKNVGENGLFVGTSSIPDEGESVRLRFTMPGGEKLEVSGLVWWTTGSQAQLAPARSPGFGLRLLEENPDYQAAVQRLL
jgi:Tfp pilus assembly protein PilZ